MNENIAYCGLNCFNCPAYQATIKNDDSLRKQTAEEWGKMFKTEINPSDINCKGCKSDLLFVYCRTCDIRECNLEKSHDNCAICASFGCDRLERFMQNAPEARKNLEQIKTQQSSKSTE